MRTTKLVIIIVVAVLLFIALLLGLLYLGIQYTLGRSEAFGVAMNFLHTEESIIEEYGLLQKTGLFRNNSYVQITNKEGTANFRFHTTENMAVNISLVYENGTWTVEEWEISP
ncbi:MAG: hypothetical protein FWE69_02600 [Clostridiales bacterium]|nr:hypothetical protein [Clostridiales bacterium]